MGETVPLTEQVIVVIGASAGGVDALEHLAGTLPRDFPAPIVVAQHLDPSHESRLAEILRQRTPLRVALLAESATLAPGTLYVVPSGADVEISGTAVSISPRDKRGQPVPSIDTLFRSAARAFGDRTIAVVLSGMGSDGPAGVGVVKEAGGTVIVQDPASAAYPSLPSSIPPVNVDLVSHIDSLGALLTAVVTEGQVSEDKLNDDILRGFLLQLRARSGIDFTQYKNPTIKRRLARLMAAAHASTLPDYMRYLNSHPEAYHRLVSSFLIKVTGFFRDPQLYQYLQEHTLPEIVDAARQERSELRLWSAGCATGEEAYSLAIALSEVLGNQIESVPIRIFATDLDAESIAFARRGMYPASSLTDVPPQLVEKYFYKVDDSYQVRKGIRNLTVFGEYDLGQRAPFPRIDLILCRNVLIYFTKELQQRTLQLFAFSLREGGYLVLGKAETTSPLTKYFSPLQPMLKVFRRQGERLLIPGPTFSESRAPVRVAPAPRIGQRSFSAQRRATDNPHWSINERLGALFFESEIGVVAIDRNYDIQTINQAARQLFGIHGRGVGEDFIHLATGMPAAQLKTILDDALRGVKSVPREVEFKDTAFDETRFLRIACYPERDAGTEAAAGAVLVIEDATAETTYRRKLEIDRDEKGQQLRRLAAQNQELLERQRALIEANKELTVTNSELRATNEHLLIAAEEAEASAEEVETLNEEMQATTEELETLNEELQATVEELNTTNEELAARGEELERVARDRKELFEGSERERKTLERALEGQTMIGAVVDRDGRVRNATDLYLKHAAANAGALPAIGETWTEIPRSMTLKRDGTVASYRVSIIGLPGDSPAEKLVVLSG